MYTYGCDARRTTHGASRVWTGILLDASSTMDDSTEVSKAPMNKHFVKRGSLKHEAFVIVALFIGGVIGIIAAVLLSKV